jgi:hypothetical protein
MGDTVIEQPWARISHTPATLAVGRDSMRAASSFCSGLFLSLGTVQGRKNTSDGIGFIGRKSYLLTKKKSKKKS